MQKPSSEINKNRKPPMVKKKNTSYLHWLGSRPALRAARTPRPPRTKSQASASERPVSNHTHVHAPCPVTLQWVGLHKDTEAGVFFIHPAVRTLPTHNDTRRALSEGRRQLRRRKAAERRRETAAATTAKMGARSPPSPGPRAGQRPSTQPLLPAARSPSRPGPCPLQHPSFPGITCPPQDTSPGVRPCPGLPAQALLPGPQANLNSASGSPSSRPRAFPAGRPAAAR